MNDITLIAGSLPQIVTSSSPRRVNKDGVNDLFLNIYIDLLGNLLKAKKENLNDLRIVYIGGYQNKEGDKITNENINTAKLYFSALSFYLKELGFGNLNKSNFTIIDGEAISQDKSLVLEKLENADCLFLGIGQDKIFGDLLDLFWKEKISIKDIVLRNNIVVASVCAGSVISARNIYGGSYDTFYYNRPAFVFPKCYETLGINPVTIEPNYNSSSKDVSLNQKFRLQCLIPDSKKKAFFASYSDSVFTICNGSIYAVGSVSLFINGLELIITSSQIADITYLNSLVELYNSNQNSVLFDKILVEAKKLKRLSYEQNVFNNFATDFESKEREFKKAKNKKIADLKKLLKSELLSLFQNRKYFRFDLAKLSNEFLVSLNLESDNEEEIYLKFYMIFIIKKYSNLFKNNYALYYATIYEVILDLTFDDDLIPYYFVQTFSSLYPNGDMKRLLKLANKNINKSVNEFSGNNKLRLLLKVT